MSDDRVYTTEDALFLLHAANGRAQRLMAAADVVGMRLRNLGHDALADEFADLMKKAVRT